MSSDFAYLQAFSVLSRLDLLRIESCELQPIGGETIDIRKASSGQQQMLCSIFGLAAAVTDEAVVLIDEPELSLHPRWQMQFFKYLETILSVVRNCHVIIATHSPLIVQAAALHNVQVISMGHDTAEQTTTELPTTNNNSVEKMLVDVFDTPIPDSLHISKEILGLVTRAEAGRGVAQKDYLGPLPSWAQELAQKLFDEGLFPEVPDQVIVNNYDGPQGISKHIDCPECFRGPVATISLLETWDMVFTRKVAGETLKFVQPLPRRSVALLAGDARSRWLHEIPERLKEHKKTRVRRISVTFRKVDADAPAGLR